MSKAALDLFGKLLMEHVRDQTIQQLKMIEDGRMKGEESVNIHARLSQMSPSDREFAMTLVSESVDRTIHNLLWLLEQEEDLRVSIELGDQTVSDLREISDGLCGELYSDEGWIARFSHE
ncbi:hypothetical protein EP7_003557 [Isosphaeraceae bacterium EP7]